MTKNILNNQWDKTRVRASFHRRYGEGVGWNVAGTFFLQGSTFVVNVVLANLLGKSAFGEFYIVQTTLLTFASLAQLATGITATKFVAEYRDNDAERTGRILGLCSNISILSGIAGTLLLLGVSGWVANDILRAPNIEQTLIIGIVFVLFSVMNGFQLGALAGLESYKTLAKASIFQSLIYITTCIFFGWWLGVPGAIGAFAFTSIVRWAFFALALKHEVRKRDLYIDRKNSWRERALFYSFSLPASINGLTAMPAIWMANTLLIRQPNGFSELGVYGAAVVLKNIILLLPQIFNNVGLSFLNNRFGAGDSNNYWRLFRLNFLYSGAVMIAGIFVMAVLGRWLLGLFGPGFSDGYDLLMILLVATFFEALAISIYQIVQSSGRMWLSFYFVTLPRDILLITMALLFVPRYGSTGLAIAYTVSWAVAFCSIILVATGLKQKLKV